MTFAFLFFASGNNKRKMTNEIFMQRCFDLARLGAGAVSPNPMVGAVLVHESRIIGEGWHRAYGKAHAEVNCVDSVHENDRHLIEKSTLYVSLEPCCFQGKTPACTDLILRLQIPKVVIADLDETAEVAGKSVEILRKAGVVVVTGVCGSEKRKPSEIRNTFVTKKRPYIQLKLAKTADGYMGVPGKQCWFSNHLSRIVAHKGRSEFDAILVGTETALTDDPALTNRLWFGKSPLRIVLDRTRKLPKDLKMLWDGGATWVICEVKRSGDENTDSIQFFEMDFGESLLENLVNLLFQQRKSSLIVEGGSYSLKQFLKKGLWDEAVVFSTPMRLGEGIIAPTPTGTVLANYQLGSDTLTIFRNQSQSR